MLNGTVDLINRSRPVLQQHFNDKTFAMLAEPEHFFDPAGMPDFLLRLAT